MCTADAILEHGTAVHSWASLPTKADTKESESVLTEFMCKESDPVNTLVLQNAQIAHNLLELQFELEPKLCCHIV